MPTGSDEDERIHMQLSPTITDRTEGALVAGGRFHDIDFARLELLALMGEHPGLRVTVRDDYEDVAALCSGTFLVTYTVDVRPSLDAQRAIRDWVERGGRWLALHGTNSVIELGGPDGVECPAIFPLWADTLGSQFIAHPPIAPFRVEAATTDERSAAYRWLIEGIDAFEAEDELYLSDYHAAVIPLLQTHWNGTATGFARRDWTTTDPVHLVMYVRELGAGSVVYLTLGHARGHHDMRPIVEHYPRIERGSWVQPAFIELLRRSLRWAAGATS